MAAFDAEGFLAQLVAQVGVQGVLLEGRETEPYLRDWRDRYKGTALAVVVPGSTEEVSGVVRLCATSGVAVVPQAGNTGLTGGAVPRRVDGPCIVLNVSRLNRVREVDIGNNSITVEAGCILENVRSEAEKHQRLFPLLLGSVGSCEVGGLVSTNAGGTAVLRYGNMRELVLGLEVVLPDGRVWNGLRALRKDNTGYDLKQLFVGAEGTLGVVTAAVLKLFPMPTASATAMVATDGVQQAVDLLGHVQGQIGQRIEAFEIMSLRQIEIVLAQNPQLQNPMPLASPWYVLIEIADNAVGWDPIEHLEQALAGALEQGFINDAVVAMDIAKARRIWDLRHHISESNKRAGFTVSNDTSVPISRLPDLVHNVTERVLAAVPGTEICHCGHIGDGNIHVIAVLSRLIHTTPNACEKAAATINLIVHEESVALNGSISAEHGIGLMHVERLERFKPALDLELMRSIKQVFDPLHLMNPGKIMKM